MASKTKTQSNIPTAPSTNPAFSVVRTLTLPAFQFEVNTARYIHIMDAMRISQAKNQKKGEEGKAMEPAHVCTGVDAVTGEKGTVIVASVLRSIFEEDYKGDAYVGKTFELIKLPKPAGKRYHAWSVQEVEAAK